MYLDYFDMSDEPFRVTPDPDFLFLSDQYREAMAAIVYGIAKRKGFICITGEVGVGKTTILRSYLDNVEDKSLVFIYIFNPRVSFPVLMRTILRDLGQPTDGEASELVERLHEHLIACYKANKTVVLFIDEAQNMPVETLENMRMLSNLETSTDKLIQIVLVGQPELNQVLAEPVLRPLRNRIVVRALLHPLSPEDSLAYIRHRLHRVALSDRPVFDKRAVNRIVKAAKGVPRVINILCDAALITAFGYRARPVTARIAREVIRDTLGASAQSAFPWALTAVAAGLVVAVALGSWAYLRNPFRHDDPIADLIIATEHMAQAVHPGQMPPVGAGALAKPLGPRPDTMNEAILPAPPPIAESPASTPPPAPDASFSAEAFDSGRPVPLPPTPKPAAASPAETPTSPPVPDADPAARRPQKQAVITANSRSGEAAGKPYRLKFGDTLSKVSIEIFGTVTDATLEWLQRSNPDITDVNRVWAGQVITVPTAPSGTVPEQEAALRKSE